MKKLSLFLIAAILTFATFNQVKATSYTATTTGVWTTTTIWAPNGTPGASDDVTINSGVTVTIGASQACNNYNNNGAFAASAASTLTINGNVGGTGTTYCAGNGWWPNFTFAGTNKTISGSSSINFPLGPAGNVLINFSGTYTVNSGASFALMSAPSRNFNITIGGNLTNNGTLTLGDNTANTKSITISSGVTLTNSSGAVLNIGSTIGNNGTLDFTASGNTVAYQNTLTTPVVKNATYSNLTINGSAKTVTLNANTTVSGIYTNTAGSLATGALTFYLLGNNGTTIAGAIVISTGGTLRIGGQNNTLTLGAVTNGIVNQTITIDAGAT